MGGRKADAIAESRRLGRAPDSIAESRRLGRAPVANADAVEIRRQFAPSASHLHSSALTGGASEAQQSPADFFFASGATDFEGIRQVSLTSVWRLYVQQSPAELRRLLAKESKFSLEGLSASCLSSNKVGSAHSLTHQCSDGERVLLASAFLR